MGRREYPRDALGLSIPDGSWPPGREAPARLEVVRRFCNTQNMEAGADVLRTPDELRDYLIVEGFGDPGTVTGRAHARVVRLRAVLRAMVVAGADQEARVAALRAFDDIAAPLRLTVRLEPEPRLQPVRGGVDAFLARVADAVFVARIDGTWSRLRACAHCGWVVYDHSKNASGVWCSPLACGTRMKARAWRARQRG